MKDAFTAYLIERGYKQFTDTGKNSTVYDYVKRIEKIMMWESYDSWNDVVDNIEHLCTLYGPGGAKEEYGKKSHNAVICALLRFKEFCRSLF